MDFNLDDAPRIGDFSLALTEESEGGLHIRMMSRSRGHLAGFPAWDHADRDLRHFTHDDIPLGDEEEPYLDAADAWRIVISPAATTSSSSKATPPPAPSHAASASP